MDSNVTAVCQRSSWEPPFGTFRGPPVISMSDYVYIYIYISEGVVVIIIIIITITIIIIIIPASFTISSATILLSYHSIVCSLRNANAQELKLIIENWETYLKTMKLHRHVEHIATWIIQRFHPSSKTRLGTVRAHKPN